MKIENLTKKYNKHLVLRDINLTLENKVYGMLGTNGSGKTTFIRLITGLIKPNVGTLEGFDHILIGYLPQKFGLLKEMTLYKHMEYFCCLKDIKKENWDNEINRVLELVNMAEQKDLKCKKLSGGMIRRVGIAQTLLGEPDILLYDEPTTGLDPQERLRFQTIISQYSGKLPILISTHIVDDVDTLCDCLLILKNKQMYTYEDINTFINQAKGYVSIVEQLKPNMGALIKEFKEDNQTKFRILNNEGNDTIIPTLEDAYVYFLEKTNE